MSESVTLYMYDITGGMAKNLSMAFIGKQIDAVYHTSIVVYGTQYYFGGGICKQKPETTPFGKPIEKREMGKTEMSKEDFDQLLNDIAPQYSHQKYNILKHNCNHFTDAACRLLLDKGIPDIVLKQAQQILNTPMGQMFRPMLQQMETGKMGQMPQMGGFGNNQGFGGYQGFGGNQGGFK